MRVETALLIHYYVPTFACRLTLNTGGHVCLQSRGAGDDERGIPTAN